MDFELNDTQADLAAGVRALCQGRFDSAGVRALIPVGGVDRSRWRELADTGVFSLTISEAAGGVGLGWADAVVVFEQLGRSMVPGPLVATVLAADLPGGGIEGAATGDVVVGIVDGRHDTLVVEHPASIDVLLVRTDRGIERLDPRSLGMVTERLPLDPLTPVARVGSLPAGDLIAGAEAAELTWRRGTVLTSALQLGLSWGAIELAVAYANGREQFGRPIGSFQAVKHMCADMATRTEVARAAVYLAGVALDAELAGDTEIADPVRAAACAAIVAGEAASLNGKDCVQVHGGMGYTWEVDAHLFLKRAWVHETQFGDTDDHAEVMASVV